MNRPRGGFRRSAFWASHRFNRADTPAATRTPAPIRRAFWAIAEVARGRDLVSGKCTVRRLPCTTARASEDVALRDNGQCNYSFLWPVDKNSHRTNDRFFVLGGP